MDNNFDNTPDNTFSAENSGMGQEQRENSPGTDFSQGQQAYTDPNAGYQPNNQSGNAYGYYQQPNPNAGWNQDNYSYNVGNNTGYTQPNNSGMDESPMTMGEWLVTILISVIPCAGIIMYFVWAFSKTGNINRRNYCRASLIITGISLVLVIIYLVFVFSILAGTMGAMDSIYY